jgi:cytochrome c556
MRDDATEEIEFHLEHEEAFASMPAAERDKLPAGDFAWPEERKFPITDQKHLDAAVKLIGRAPKSKQAAIKARIKGIARRKGLSLPESWK